MRRTTTLTLLLSATLMAGVGAQADDEQYTSTNEEYFTSDDQAGTIGDDTSGVTTKGADELTGGRLKDEKFAVRPQAGVMVFNDANQGGSDTSARAIGGLTMDMNATSFFMDKTPLYIGPQIGLLYSHTGQANSGFFGANEGVGSGGSNFLNIPLNLKAGYNISDAFRVSARGGVNYTYRSVGNAMDLGATTSSGSSSVWRPYPNAGADIDFGFGQNIALTLRPDWTFTPGADVFTGTLALAIPVG